MYLQLFLFRLKLGVRGCLALNRPGTFQELRGRASLQRLLQMVRGYAGSATVEHPDRATATIDHLPSSVYVGCSCF